MVHTWCTIDASFSTLHYHSPHIYPLTATLFPPYCFYKHFQLLIYLPFSEVQTKKASKVAHFTGTSSREPTNSGQMKAGMVTDGQQKESADLLNSFSVEGEPKTST